MKERAPEHLRFAVLATDSILFTVWEHELLVRVAPVRREPYFPDHSGFPGGLILPTETTEQAVTRILKEKGAIHTPVHCEQLYTFSEIDRDPRGRVVAVAYLATVPWLSLHTAEQTDTPDAWWVPISKVSNLAYDHNAMLRVATNRLKSRITYTTLISTLMPQEFTLSELEETYECILARELDKRNFRKKILKLDILKPLNKKRSGGQFRPAELYSFKSKKVEDIEVI